MSKRDEIIRELKELTACDGIELPYPGEEIADLEAGGAYVDLATAAVIDGDADNEVFALTMIGEATAIVIEQAVKGGVF